MLAQETNWIKGDSYEHYVGRWSRLVAREFLLWLGLPQQRRWLDVGCGTGALSQTILTMTAPMEIRGIDPSERYVNHARHSLGADLAAFDTGDARALPYESEYFDLVVSGLALNFVPQPEVAITEMMRVAKTEGTVGIYVWDYAGMMQLMRYFWDAAVRLNPAASELDEGIRFPLCKPERLHGLFKDAGLIDVETRAIDVPTIFRDFDDYWSPFLEGQGPAPGYATSLTENERNKLRDAIRAELPIDTDGSIHLIARAWAVRGRK